MGAFSSHHRQGVEERMLQQITHICLQSWSWAIRNSGLQMIVSLKSKSTGQTCTASRSAAARAASSLCRRSLFASTMRCKPSFCKWPTDMCYAESCRFRIADDTMRPNNVGSFTTRSHDRRCSEHALPWVALRALLLICSHIVVYVIAAGHAMAQTTFQSVKRVGSAPQSC